VRRFERDIHDLFATGALAGKVPVGSDVT